MSTNTIAYFNSSNTVAYFNLNLRSGSTNLSRQWSKVHQTLLHIQN